MGVTFNAFEVFEIAEQIERNGRKFYRRAAELFAQDRSIRKMFFELANWEAQHEAVFAGMRKQLSEQEAQLSTFRPEDDLLPEAQAMAGLAVFGIKPDPSEELTGKESKVDVLRLAMANERDSIVYYTGLKDFVPAEASREKIDDIIKEEMRHISILTQSLREKELAGE